MRTVLMAVAVAGLLGLVPVPSGAGPASPADRPVWGDLAPPIAADIVVRQPDGSAIKAHLTPGEIGGTLEAAGYTITRRHDGWWMYATGRDAGDLVASAARAGLDPPPTGVPTGVGRTESIWAGPDGDIRAQAFRALQVGFRRAQVQAQAAGVPVVFRFPVLMLATWWDAEQGQTSPQFQPGNDKEKFQKLLNGFGGNPKGTLTEFYFENSYGQFLVQVDVFGPYTSQRSRQDRCYYGGIEPPPSETDDLDPFDSVLGIGGGGAIGMASEAIPQADPQVDFAEYDNDGDGEIDFTAILHSGPDMAATGDPCHTWSHAIDASLGNPGGIPTNDGVVAARLFTMPEIDLEIGVAVHEMAHALGEPDYYNPSYTSMGTGDWDIMAGGSWFGNPPGSNPTGFNPASKVFQRWMTPRLVHDDVRGISLPPRSEIPFAGYQGNQENPNIVLVPTKWITVGATDQYGHTWTEDDVYGLVLDGERGHVVEGYYIENWSRMVNGPAIHPAMSRAPYFDRQALGSGLMVWHFDYFKRSNVYFGANDAGEDPNRPQMDPVEWDWNDNTQELQLALTRGEPQDLVFGAATGITSGTRQLPAGIPEVSGPPQAGHTWTGAVPPAGQHDHPFTIEANPANYLLVVTATGTGDCTLQLLKDGQAVTPVSDAGFVGDSETVRLTEPAPGDYVARVGDFAACANYSGTVEFKDPSSIFFTTGAGDTWSNWTEQPTGWAFTNVGPGIFEGLDHAADAGGDEAITLDLLNLGATDKDVSPGFAAGARNAVGGRAGVTAGRDNAMSVRIFNNGGFDLPGVAVEVRDGSATGPLVASGTVDVTGYSGTEFAFTYKPPAEGAFDLFTVVDPGGAIAEVHEGNNVQKSPGWAGPANPVVLVVDDDGALDAEETYAGALASLGVPYALATEHVDAATMAQYQAVIWEGGLERYQGQMDENDRTAVAAYLEGGGRLLYSSPRAASALGEAPGRTNPLSDASMPVFLRDFFGVQYEDTQQVGGGMMTGTGDIFGTATYQSDVFPGRPLQDSFSVAEWPAGEAQTVDVMPVLTWEKGGAGSLMGVRAEARPGEGGHRTIFLGFNLSQLVDADDAVSILGAGLEHLGLTLGTYQAASAEPLVFHTQVRNRVSGIAVPVNAIVLGGQGAEPASLFYRRHGPGGYFEVPLANGSRNGVRTGAVPAEAVTPDGVDYYLRAGLDSTYDPRRTEAHGIGVALPEVPQSIARLDPLAATGVASSFSFAEGTTLPGFEEYLLLSNPNDHAVAGTVVYALEGTATAPEQRFEIAPLSRLTIHVADAPGVGAGRVGVGAVVRADGPIAAERAMYFDADVAGTRVNGAHTVPGAATARTTWLFSEGSTQPGFQEYLTLVNPGTAPAAATLTYGVEGAGRSTQAVEVAAGKRVTVDVNSALPGIVGHSTQVTSDQPLLVERPVYMHAAVAGLSVNGGHVAFGSEAQTNFWFAEGTLLPDFRQFVTLANPDPTRAATVELRYLLENAPAQQRVVTVEPGSRRTIQVFDAADPGGLGPAASDAVSQGVGLHVRTTAPFGIVAERPLYFDRVFPRHAERVSDGHTTPGAPAAARGWHFAEGTTLPNFDTFITIANPGAEQTARITYFTDVPGEAPVVREVVLAASSRRTVQVFGPSDQGGLDLERVGVAFTVEAAEPIVVERPIYVLGQVGELPHVSGGTDVVGFVLEP